MSKSSKSGKSAPDKLAKLGATSGVALSEIELGRACGGSTLRMPKPPIKVVLY